MSKRLAIFIFFFTASLAFSQNAPLEKDSQMWNDVSVAVPLIKEKDKKGNEFNRLTFLVNGTLRIGRGISRPIDERFGFGFNYRVNRFVSLVPDYVYRFSQPFPGRTNYENRLRMAVILEKRWKKFSIANRNSFEYRFRHSQRDSSFYRNRLRFNYPVNKGGKLLFTPYVSNEPFYNFRQKAWTRNEVHTGISRRINPNLTGDFYFLLLKDRSLPRTIIGFGLNLRFAVK